MRKNTPQSTRRLLKRIRGALGNLPPTLVGMEFVRFVRDTDFFRDVVTGILSTNRQEEDFAWSVYISHDPCHDDGKGSVADRNTVIAIHRWNGTFRIIGRELDRKYALKLARGLI
jgi:hypothetical protein